MPQPGDRCSESQAASGKLLVAVLTAALCAVVSLSARPASGDALAPTPNRPIKDKWALVVGVSKFKDPGINLKYAAKDAQDFANFLTREENFAPDHVQILTDEQATRGNVLSLLGDRWLPRVANPDDLVVLFFSSHGSPSDCDVAEVNYLLVHDSNKENLFASGIPMQDLVQIIKGRVHSDRVVVFMDACHSGATVPFSKGLARNANVDAEAIAQGTGQLIISSSQSGQRSWESTEADNGVFTRTLIAALKANGSTTTLGSAFDFLKEKVQEQVLRERGVLQTPVMHSKWQGRDLVLATPSTSPRPGLSVTLPETTVPTGGAGAAGTPPAVTGAASPAGALPPDADPVPKVWHSLEKNTWGTLLGTWIYDKDRREFDASYNTGSTAILKLDEFSSERVRLSGRFQGRSITAPAGQKYSLSGTRAGKKVYGNVTYDHLGIKVKGHWEAWFE